MNEAVIAEVVNGDGRGDILKEKMEVFICVRDGQKTAISELTNMTSLIGMHKECDRKRNNEI